MKSLKEMVERFKRGPSDVVGVDAGASSVKAVRLRKANDQITVVAADLLPAQIIPEGTDAEPVAIKPVTLPPRLKARVASLAVTGEKAVVKLLSFPGHFDASAEEKIVESLGLDKPDAYRVSYKVVTPGHGKSESRVLAVALPEPTAKAALDLFPSGTPAPFSLEVSGLAAMSAFANRTVPNHKDEAVGLLEFGGNIAHLALFNKGVLCLVRRFEVGTNSLLTRVQQALGVDAETARGIVMDGAFDISQSVADVTDPLMKQVLVSRDYLERRENCHVAKFYVSGGLASSKNAMEEIRSALAVETVLWNPLEGLVVAEDALPEGMAGQEWRFSAAVGAGLATLEES